MKEGEQNEEVLRSTDEGIAELRIHERVDKETSEIERLTTSWIAHGPTVLRRKGRLKEKTLWLSSWSKCTRRTRRRGYAKSRRMDDETLQLPKERRQFTDCTKWSHRLDTFSTRYRWRKRWKSTTSFRIWQRDSTFCRTLRRSDIFWTYAGARLGEGRGRLSTLTGPCIKTGNISKTTIKWLIKLFSWWS